ncbi:MAG: carbohydrate ABC transporter permease [Candidatus Humimicrobiaceae bacterium]
MIKKRNLNQYIFIRIIPKIGLHTILIIGSFFMVLPFLWMIISSFKPNIDIVSVGFKLFSPNWTLDNYRKVLGDMNIGRAYFNSIFVASVATAFTIFSASAAGFLFSKLKFWGRDALFFLVLGSVMIPPQIVLIPLYLMISRAHLVNSYPGLIIPFLINAFGVFLMRQFIYGIPNDLLEAARIDGASDWKIYFRIILPLVKPAIAVVGILTFLWAYDEFLWPLVVINNNAMRTLPLILGRYAMAEGGVVAGASMATTSLVLGPLLLIYFFFQRFFIKGISMTGMKG